MNITQKLQNVITDHVTNNTVVPDLTSEITSQELQFTKQDIFHKTPTPSVLQTAQNFYQNLYYYNIINRNFTQNINTHALLTYLTSKQKQKKSETSLKTREITSLHLLFLYSTNRLDNYHSNYQLLSESEKNTPLISSIKNFAQFITLGNYIKAIEKVQNLSIFHKIVLENIQESRKLDTCKIVDLCKNNIELEEIRKLFCVRNEAEMKELGIYVDQLFGERKVNWKIVGGSVFKRKMDRSCLNADLVIRDMIELVEEVDKII